MDTTKVPELDVQRCRLIGAAAMTAAVAQLGAMGIARAQTSDTKPAGTSAGNPASTASFGPLKQIDAGSSRAP
jgi:hypothetical protein